MGIVFSVLRTTDLRRIMDKPPMGIATKKDWDKQRAIDLLGAIIRYERAGSPVPEDWITEYCDLLWELYS